MQHRCPICSSKFILPRQKLCEPCRTEARGGDFQAELVTEARRILEGKGFQ